MKTILMESLEKRIKSDEFLSGFNLDTSFITEATEINYDSFFSEAVFNNGKEKVKPILESIAKVKELLEEKIKEQQISAKSNEQTRRSKIEWFNPISFWKSKAIKELEDKVKEVFGFRNVIITPSIEGYHHKDDRFDDLIINAFVYTDNRYPIEGLVTDDGFYDKTHSCTFSMVISLGLIRLMEPGEILSIILHEIGHKIDPALMDISYTETNILTKILTDREAKYTPREKQYLAEKKRSFLGQGLIAGGLFVLYLVAVLGMTIWKAWDFIKFKFIGKDKWRAQQIEKLRKIAKKDEAFKRQTFNEAFADNITRMYGYGADMARAFGKLTKYYEEHSKRFHKREYDRERIIAKIVGNALKDEHRTDVHRIYAMIKEYEEDLKDPSIPKKVKENLKADKEELEAVFDKYLNAFDEFKNKIHNMILEEIKEIDKKNEEKKKEKDTF